MLRFIPGVVVLVLLFGFPLYADSLEDVLEFLPTVICIGIVLFIAITLVKQFRKYQRKQKEKKKSGYY